jgi:hypothetical protein
MLADRPVRALLVIVLTPILQFFPSVCKAQEPVGVQAFDSEAAIEGLDKCVVGWLARSREVECYTALVGP